MFLEQTQNPSTNLKYWVKLKISDSYNKLKFPIHRTNLKFMFSGQIQNTRTNLKSIFLEQTQNPRTNLK